MPFPDFTPSLPVFLKTMTERRGDAEMIVLGDQRVTYKQANERSAEIAKGLLAAGVTKGSRVALLMPNGPDWVVNWLAITRIGALCIPFNTFYQKRELYWVMRHSDCQVLLTLDKFLKHSYLQRLEDCAPGLKEQKKQPFHFPSLPFLRNVYVWGEVTHPWAQNGPEALKALAAEHPQIDDAYLAEVEKDVTPADPMIMIYSSGSTADPKAAIHSHGAVIRHSFNLNVERKVFPEDRLYSPMPFFWVGGFVFGLLSAMHAGACMLCEDHFDPGATLAFLEKEKATIVAGWPHYGKAMTDHEDFAKRDLSSLRAGNIWDVLPDGVRPDDPELRSNSLGMTETCGPHTFKNMDSDMPESLRGSFGKSVDQVQHKIVHPDTGETLATGELGEICVRGYNVTQGLYKLEREDVFDADGWYHTGDGGYFTEEGYLYFKARIRELIKTAGASVTPREVELVLETLDSIKAAFVVGIPDPERGQNVAVAIVREAGKSVDADSARKFLRGELSAYKVPKHYFFVDSQDDLPFTDTAKIDKKKLTAIMADKVKAGEV